MNLFPRKKKLFASRAETRRRRNRNRLAGVAVLLVIAGGAVFLANGLFEGSPFAGFAPLSGEQADRQDGQAEDPSPDEGAAPSEPDGEARQEQSPPEEPLPDPEQKTPEAAAYVAVAPQFPGVGPESIGTVYRSRMDPSWASVRFRPGGENKDFVVFSHKEGGLWRAEKSIRADEPNYPKNDVVPLAGGVPHTIRNESAASKPRISSLLKESAEQSGERERAGRGAPTRRFDGRVAPEPARSAGRAATARRRGDAAGARRHPSPARGARSGPRLPRGIGDECLRAGARGAGRRDDHRHLAVTPGGGELLVLRVRGGLELHVQARRRCVEPLQLA